MSALSPVRRSPAKRPRWLVVTLVSVSMLALFAIGFAAALFIYGSPSSVVATVDEVVQGSVESNAGATVAPEPCETTLVAPAEVLPRPDSIVVNVYNSTQRGGLAGTTAQELSQRGFRINKVENDPLGVSLRGVGEIRYGPNGAENAQLLLFYFPGAAMVDDGRSGPRVDISLGRGFEAMEDQALVAATLASPSPSLSGPGCPSE
ncbi:MAG: LytR C-terminal domain-containing protein [Candidatus Nanopelagicales bacterium]